MPALALVAGNAVASVKFQPAGNQHHWIVSLEQSLKKLHALDHDRAAAGLSYVYPVVSRRAGGVSVGINLNPNNACNWRCIYCQVPELKRGAAPVIDLTKLERELGGFLRELLQGNFMRERVPPEARRLNDIALSGNGEPTSSRQFNQVVSLIGRIMRDLSLAPEIKLVLITNGSLMDRPQVQSGLKEMSRHNGEVWFKLDNATRQGIQRINSTRLALSRVRENLRIAAALCPTWLQTMVLQIDGEPPSAEEREAYLEFVRNALEQGITLRGVLLYGLARPSMQPEAPRLSPVSSAWMDRFGGEIRALGLDVRVNP